MPIKKRIAAHKPNQAKVDAHIRFALRHAIAAQKRVIEDAGAFGETEAQLVGEYERLAYYEKLVKQEALFRIDS